MATAVALCPPPAALECVLEYSVHVTVGGDDTHTGAHAVLVVDLATVVLARTPPGVDNGCPPPRDVLGVTGTSQVCVTLRRAVALLRIAVSFARYVGSGGGTAALRRTAAAVGNKMDDVSTWLGSEGGDVRGEGLQVVRQLEALQREVGVLWEGVTPVGLTGAVGRAAGVCPEGVGSVTWEVLLGGGGMGQHTVLSLCSSLRPPSPAVGRVTAWECTHDERHGLREPA